MFPRTFATVAGRLLPGAQPCHPEQADSLWLLVQPWALVAAVTANPSTFMHSAWLAAGLTITQSGELAEPDPLLRKGLEDCTKHMVIWSAFHVDHPPCETVKCLLRLKAFVKPLQMQQKYPEHAFSAMPTCSTVMPTLQSKPDCDSVTQVWLCFMAVTACSYTCWLIHSLCETY